MALESTATRKIAGAAGWLMTVFCAGAIGAVASVDAATFYQVLQQPAWSPPAGVFGPVWTLLYTMMAVSAWLIWLRGGFVANRLALLLFLAQLFFNALWSWLFFQWHLGLTAFLDIILLWFLIVATIMAFWRIRPLAAVLLMPYLLWVSFAMALNFSLWQLNPLSLG